VDNETSNSIELVRRARNGDDDALDRLFRRYYDRVRRIVRMRLGARLKGRLEEEDILQDTFIAAVEHFDRFELRDDASLIQWLSRLAYTRMLAAADFHGAQKRGAGRVISGWGGFEDSSVISKELADRIEGPSERAARDELKSIVEDCISELAPDYRELILLREYVGMSWEQIAAETQRSSADAARMTHSRAMLDLARRVRERSGDAGASSADVARGS
jgi:RNA polymerase sigma-70 factor (ECF subfamily)